MQTHVKQIGGVVSLFIGGDVTREEALALWKTIETDFTQARFGFVRIADVKWKISTQDVMDLASRVPVMTQDSWGFLAGDDHSFGMLRMFTTWASDPQHRFHVFRDEASARAWLERWGCEPAPILAHGP